MCLRDIAFLSVIALRKIYPYHPDRNHIERTSKVKGQPGPDFQERAAEH